MGFFDHFRVPTQVHFTCIPDPGAENGQNRHFRHFRKTGSKGCSRGYFRGQKSKKWPKMAENHRFSPFLAVFFDHFRDVKQNTLGAILSRFGHGNGKFDKMHFYPLRYPLILTKISKMADFDRFRDPKEVKKTVFLAILTSQGAESGRKSPKRRFSHFRHFSDFSPTLCACPPKNHEKQLKMDENRPKNGRFSPFLTIFDTPSDYTAQMRCFDQKCAENRQKCRFSAFSSFSPKR